MNLHAFAEAPLVIQIHAISAGCALITGLSLLPLPRGRKAHRTLGIITAAFLTIATISAAFIFRLSNGEPSLFHALIPVAALGLFGVSMGVAQKNWKRHKNAGRGLIYGALLIPGILAFAPDRLLHIVAFG